MDLKINGCAFDFLFGFFCYIFMYAYTFVSSDNIIHYLFSLAVPIKYFAAIEFRDLKISVEHRAVARSSAVFLLWKPETQPGLHLGLMRPCTQN